MFICLDCFADKGLKRRIVALRPGEPHRRCDFHPREKGIALSAISPSPVHGRPLTTRPSAGRVRPDWNSAVSGSGELGACRYETGLTEPPESDDQLAGERYDHQTTDSSPASRRSVFEPFAERVDWLMAQPAPRHLDELSPDPGWIVTADPLVALRVPAGPRGWRYANPARELPAGCGTRDRRSRASAGSRRSRRSPSLAPCP